jgi:hypothetical protein
VIDVPPAPRALVRAMERRYPAAWRQIDTFRGERGRSVPAWPEWCYVPIAATRAIVDAGAPQAPLAERVRDAGWLAAAAAWRIGQGIYRWDPALAAAMAATPAPDPLPVDVLLRQPEWGLYHELPPGLLEAWGEPVRGFLMHVEADDHTGPELRVLVDQARGWTVIPILLGAGTWAGALAALASSAARVVGRPVPVVSSSQADPGRVALMLALYTCGQDADVDGPGQPGNPAPRPTRRGLRVFPRDEGPRVWAVGARVGAALTRASEGTRAAGPRDGSGHHAPPRPHVRRAHWHTYWCGTRAGPQTRSVRWVHPVLVGGRDTIPTVHRVAGAVPANTQGEEAPRA